MKHVKKLIALILTASLLMAFSIMLSSCGNNSGNGDNTSGNDQTTDAASGNDETTGKTETTDSETSGESETNADASEAGESTDILAMINKVYDGVSGDVLPKVAATEIALDDANALSYNTGLTDTTGIKTIVVSEALISAQPYSLVYIRCEDGADVSSIKQSLYDNINTRKWVCVEAEKKACVEFGNDILLVMGSEEQVNAVYTSLETVAGTDSLTLGSKLAN